MGNYSTEKWLTRINFVIVAYFAIIYALYYFSIDFVIIGVFRELLTIPFLLAQIVLLFLSIRFLAKEKRLRLLFGISLTMLVICSVLTIGSFIYS